VKTWCYLLNCSWFFCNVLQYNWRNQTKWRLTEKKMIRFITYKITVGSVTDSYWSPSPFPNTIEQWSACISSTMMPSGLYTMVGDYPKRQQRKQLVRDCAHHGGMQHARAWQSTLTKEKAQWSCNPTLCTIIFSCCMLNLKVVSKIIAYSRNVPMKSDARA
jgi:hypothetical protein